MSTVNKNEVKQTPEVEEEKSKVPLLLHRLGLMHSPESVEHGLTFQPRATDVFIVSYPKTGTTWTQQITHCLRSNGGM